MIGGATIAPPLPLLAPINLAGSATFPPAEVIMTWEDNPNNPFEEYELFRDTVSVGTTTGLTMTDTDGSIEADKAYNYTIRGRQGSRWSAVSAPTGVGIPNLVLAEAVTDLTIVHNSATQAIMDWTHSVEGSFTIDHYGIWVDGVWQLDGLNPPAPVDGLVENQSYVVSVVPVDTDGNTGATATINYTHIHSHASLGADLVTNGNLTTDLSGWNNVNNYWVWQPQGDGQAHHPIGSVNNGFVTNLSDNGIKNYHMDMRIRVMQGSMAVEVLFRDQGKTYTSFGVGWHNLVYDKTCNPSSINFKRGSNMLGNVEYCHVREIL